MGEMGSLKPSFQSFFGQIWPMKPVISAKILKFPLKKNLQTLSGFKKTCQKTDVVSKKVSFFKIPIEYQVFERHI